LAARRVKGQPSRAEINIAWCEKYIRIPEGKFVGQPLKMAEFMKDDFRAIFDNPAGTRRAIITRGRKNAKTVETAMLMLLFLCGPEATANSQLFSAAQSRDQASVLFALAAKMVRMNPDLNNNLVIRDTAKQIFCPDLGTLYRALSAEAATAFGLSPRFVAHDELGQVKGPRSPLYEALETATAAQDDPLSVIISTQAPTDADLLSLLIEDAQKGRDKRTVLRMQSAPEELDPFSVEAIRAANPAFDLFMNKAEVLAMAEDARNMPSRQSEYENLVLNRRVDRNDPFISKTIWQDNGGDVHEWGDAPVYAGLDLSGTADLTAFVPIAHVKDSWETKPTFWLPGQGLEAKSRSDRVPYDLWAKQGFLETPDSKSIEYQFVAAWLYDFCSTHNVRKIAFDRWGMKYLRPWLIEAGFTDERVDELFEEFGQGFQSMSPALRDLESVLLNGQLRHGNHPVLTMCAANAVVSKDPAGGRKLNKAKAAGRIDGMIGLTMAFGVAPLDAPEASVDDWLASLAA
jgi:phage terminase large subunit-like protein